ncbi:MAG TPA: peptidoglycan DD-metalloendopeptidase family protein [Pyrinomonadaceae bacterium]|nr:peptidoglycan DD-metalloendopeptidase family protein [Pyrinomonadaceae bacterium]
MANRARVRLLFAIVAVLGALVAFVWAMSRRSQTVRVATVTPPASSNSAAVPPVPEPALAVPSPVPSVESTVAPTPAETEGTPSAGGTPQASPVQPTPPGSLLIPVAGVRAEELRDTFQESRSEGRTHDAIDIAAPRGTPVLAASDGRIVKLWQSVPGGTTIYQLDPDDRTVYYYAHLDRYADGISEGHFARRGEVLAYVGDTGNAGAGNYHLHFSVLIVTDPKRYWDGTNVNPYPLLQGKK